MTEAELVRHEWWASLWGRLETAAYFGVVLTLAIEFAAHRLAKPHVKALDDAKNLKVAKLEVERARLETLITPRSLTLDQQITLIEALRPFEGQKIIVGSPATDGEPIWLADQIITAITAAKLGAVDQRGNIGTARGFSFGLHIGGPNVELIEAVRKALAASGQEVTVNSVWSNALLTMPNAPLNAGAAAAIFVGTKPIPKMTIDERQWRAN